MNIKKIVINTILIKKKTIKDFSDISIIAYLKIKTQELK